MLHGVSIRKTPERPPQSDNVHVSAATSALFVICNCALEADPPPGFCIARDCSWDIPAPGDSLFFQSSPTNLQNGHAVTEMSSSALSSDCQASYEFIALDMCINPAVLLRM